MTFSRACHLLDVLHSVMHAHTISLRSFATAALLLGATLAHADVIPGKALKRADPSTIQDKFLVGYQGWFTCAGDGEPITPGHHGWMHWFNSPIPAGGHPNTDLWPDVSGYSPEELYVAPGLRQRLGEPAHLFSSRHPKTVHRHFKWMAEHSVDGVFLQRFLGQCDPDADMKQPCRFRDEIGDRVREAAEDEGRVFAIMYDVTGVPAERVQRSIEQDWLHLVNDQHILDSPQYMHERGMPVLAIWGFGFADRGHTVEMVQDIAAFVRAHTPGGNAYLMAGVPAYWRTASADADEDPAFVDMFLETFDAVSPWSVGRYTDEEEADWFAEDEIDGDLALINHVNKERVKANGAAAKHVDYMPVVWPGFSGYNLSGGKWSFDYVKRKCGMFLWRQLWNLKKRGVRIMYGAMWDEYDEGTALMPVVSDHSQLPSDPRFPFMALDSDGCSNLPSDWYMRMCGLAAETLRGEYDLGEEFPLDSLMDYWQTRPFYDNSLPATENASDPSSPPLPPSPGGVEGDGTRIPDAGRPQMIMRPYGSEMAVMGDEPRAPPASEAEASAPPSPSVQRPPPNSSTVPPVAWGSRASRRPPAAAIDPQGQPEGVAASAPPATESRIPQKQDAVQPPPRSPPPVASPTPAALAVRPAPGSPPTPDPCAPAPSRDNPIERMVLAALPALESQLQREKQQRVLQVGYADSRYLGLPGASVHPRGSPTLSRDQPADTWGRRQPYGTTKQRRRRSWRIEF